jgi:hypothetical protein
MNQHAQHASPRKSHRAPARLLGLAAVAGLGLAAAPAAHADAAQQGAALPQGAAAQQDGVSQLGGIPLYPLAGTPLDLLSNNLRVPVGGMDVSTFPVTSPLRNGLPLREVPLVGKLLP